MPDIKTHRVFQQLHAFISGVTWMGGALLSLVMVFTLGPIAEAKYFPITTDIEVSLVDSTAERMTFSAVGNKVRSCSLVSAHVMVYTDLNKAPVLGIVLPVREGFGSQTRTLGYQDLGKFIVIPTGKKLKAEAVYRCHSLWNTTIHLGTWELK